MRNEHSPNYQKLARLETFYCWYKQVGGNFATKET